MFTGIIKGQGRIEAIEALPGLTGLWILLPVGADEGLEIGASVSIDGVCLTVTKIEDGKARFDVMQESLSRTTLGNLTVGAAVNVERAAKAGAENGGHLISGHVDCTACIVRVDSPENNRVITFEVPDPWMRYIFSKGFVALNGTSLTVTAANKATRTFEVWFIPETLRLTTFGEKRAGDLVNLEIERGTQVIVDTVRDYLDERLGSILPALEARSGADLGRAR